ncbi:MAG: thioredoxin reductase [Alcanivorax sp.]|jgi:thioredoxin reductase
MYDLAIIGAGPSGMRAAEIASKHGMQTVIIDEQPQAGGQILRRPPAAFSVFKWLPQRVYANLHRLYEQFKSLDDLTHLHSTAVLGISAEADNFTLHINGPSGLDSLLASKVLIASGCFDMPLVFPGAQLPGVMATGGMQAFLKSQQILPGERFMFIGSHPLQLIVACQIAKAGGDVAGVFFTPSLSHYLKVLRKPLVLLRQLPNMLFFVAVLTQLLVRRVSIKFGTDLVSAHGEDALENVVLRKRSGENTNETIHCDRLGLCFGFLTNNDLARQVGLACSWSQTSGGWIVDHDPGMRSTVPGIYVAGETTGVAGANVACLEGQLAALSAVHDSQKMKQPDYDKACAALSGPLQAAAKFAELLAEVSYPGEAAIHRTMTDDAYLCKCEEVSVGSVKATLTKNPDVSDLNALKLLTRCGMGHCQGRYCHYQSRFLLAKERNLSIDAMPGFTARFPIRPVSIGDMLGNAPTEKIE